MKDQICEGVYWSKHFTSATFHDWGTSWIELADGPGPLPVAIVELPCGQIITPEATNVRFCKNESKLENGPCPYLEDNDRCSIADLPCVNKPD